MFQLALGFAMPQDESGFALFQLHKSVGITILLLTLARLAWRLTHRPPPAVEGGLQGGIATAVHILLYGFMVGAPLTGWALVSTDPLNIPTILYGVVPWPHLWLPAGSNEFMKAAHELLAWIGVALIMLHIAGALRHQWLIKDGLLRRMAPGGTSSTAYALLALTVALFLGTGMYVSRNPVPETVGEEAPQQGPGVLTAAEAAAADGAGEVQDAATVAEDAGDELSEEAQPPGPPPVWAIQPGGRLGFTVSNGGMQVRGSFSDWSGTIRFDPEAPESADIRIDVRLASAALGDTTMDGMLQGDDFFGTSANRTATWRSTSVSRTGPGRYRANGTLSLKGVSRPQSVAFSLTGEGLRRQVQGSATIDRTAFGVGMGESAADLASSVSLNFAFEAVGRAP